MIFHVLTTFQLLWLIYFIVTTKNVSSKRKFNKTHCFNVWKEIYQKYHLYTICFRNLWSFGMREVWDVFHSTFTRLESVSCLNCVYRILRKQIVVPGFFPFPRFFAHKRVCCKFNCVGSFLMVFAFSIQIIHRCVHFAGVAYCCSYVAREHNLFYIFSVFLCVMNGENTYGKFSGTSTTMMMLLDISTMAKVH